MNLKNHNYMKGAEFKTRQFWLPFVDAVGVALQVMADVKEQAADWFKAWVKRFRTSRNVTLRYLGMEVDDALAISEHISGMKNFGAMTNRLSLRRALWLAYQSNLK